MTTQEYLLTYGVTMQMAKDYFVSHYEQPQVIYNIMKQYNLNIGMMAEILNYGNEPSDRTITTENIENYFEFNSIDFTDLLPTFGDINYYPTIPFMLDGLYSGNYSGDTEGMFFLDILDNSVMGNWQSLDGMVQGQFFGSVHETTGQIFFWDDPDVTLVGQVHEDNTASGTWQVGGFSGQWGVSISF